MCVMNKQKSTNELKKLKPRIVKILKRHGIKKAGIFGSYARGDNKKKSDIDIIIEPRKGMGLEFVGVQLELQDEIGLKIDLVTYKGIHRLIKEQVLKEEIRII